MLFDSNLLPFSSDWESGLALGSGFGFNLDRKQSRVRRGDQLLRRFRHVIPGVLYGSLSVIWSGRPVKMASPLFWKSPSKIPFPKTVGSMRQLYRALGGFSLLYLPRNQFSRGYSHFRSLAIRAKFWKLDPAVQVQWHFCAKTTVLPVFSRLNKSHDSSKYLSKSCKYVLPRSNVCASSLPSTY